MIPTVEIRPLWGNELEEARLLLTESFMQDPTIEWMLCKNETGFKERVETFMRLVHQFYADMNMPVLGALFNNDLRGVLYGGCFDDANSQEVINNWNEQLKTHFSGTVQTRVLEYENSMHDEVEPHTYLLGLLAVAKHARGRGIGSTLIKHVIAMCKEDANINTIMLDTANPDNIDLYERLGFKSTVVKAFDENFCQTVMIYKLN